RLGLRVGCLAELDVRSEATNHQQHGQPRPGILPEQASAPGLRLNEPVHIVRRQVRGRDALRKRGGERLFTILLFHEWAELSDSDRCRQPLEADGRRLARIDACLPPGYLGLQSIRSQEEML